MKDRRILVVEDEGIVALDIQTKLRRMGYDVPTPVPSAAEAIAKATELQPDLVLMDIQLEGDTDGIAAAERIHTDLGIPIVYLTAYADDTTLSRAKVAQPFAYLLKPYEERDLYVTIEIALNKHDLEQENIRLEERLHHAQKMEAIGQLTAGFAHNLNNMLQGIIGNLDLALPSAPGDVRLLLKDAEYDAERAAKLVDQLAALYRSEEGQQVAVDLGAVVEDVADLCRSVFAAEVEVTVERDDDLPELQGNREQLRQCLVNLCANARDAVSLREDDAQGILRITAQVTDAGVLDPVRTPDTERPQFVRICVIDNGVGMEKDTQDHMFEPFFTTKDPGMTTGLSLSATYGIVREHGGWIECESELDVGTAMSLFLPVLSEHPPDEATPSSEVMSFAPSTSVDPESLRGTESILVIADVDRLRTILDLMLERSGYTVHLGRDGHDGLDLYGHEGHDLDLVIVALSLAGMSSQEVVTEIRGSNPRARVLVITGHPTWAKTYQGASAVLLKPFNTTQLLQAVRRLLST